MTMTNEEIVRDYRQAAQPAKQIAVLADLNQCSRQEIAQILKDAGEKLPGWYSKKEKKAAKNDTAAESRDDTAAKAATTCSENREPGRDISELRGEALRVIRALLKLELDAKTFYDRAFGVVLLEERLEGKGWT